MCLLNEKTVRQIRRAGGDEVLCELFEVFIDFSLTRQSAALDAVSSRDPTAARKAFHTIRSSSATIGLQFLSETAAVLEDLAAAGRWEEVNPILRKFEEEFSESVDYLKLEVAKISNKQ